MSIKKISLLFIFLSYFFGAQTYADTIDKKYNAAIKNNRATDLNARGQIALQKSFQNPFDFIFEMGEDGHAYFSNGPAICRLILGKTIGAKLMSTNLLGATDNPENDHLECVANN